MSDDADEFPNFGDTTPISMSPESGIAIIEIFKSQTTGIPVVCDFDPTRCFRYCLLPVKVPYSEL